MKFLKPDDTFTQDLSDAALSHTTTIGRKFKLQEITIHFSEVVTETITITRDSKQGANYDDVLNKRSLVAEQDYVFRPEGECDFLNGDEVKVQCTNANVTGVAYGKIKTSELP